MTARRMAAWAAAFEPATTADGIVVMRRTLCWLSNTTRVTVSSVACSRLATNIKSLGELIGKLLHCSASASGSGAPKSLRNLVANPYSSITEYSLVSMTTWPMNSMAPGVFASAKRTVMAASASLAVEIPLGWLCSR